MNSKYFQEPRELQDYKNGISPEAVIICPMCKKNNAQIVFNSHPMVRFNIAIPCEQCYQEPEVEETRYYEKKPTSIWKNEQGKEIAVDQRGNRMESPYKNREYDRHGWSQTNPQQYKKHLRNKGYL